MYYTVFHFISVIMNFFWRRPATNQSACRPGWRLTLACNLQVLPSCHNGSTAT